MRKARVTSNWTMKKGTVTHTNYQLIISTYSENGYFTEIIANNGTIYNYNGDAGFTFEFKNDGTANMQRKI